MKQTFVCTEYNPDLYRMNFSLHPKGFVPKHFHKHMDELFEVTEGEGIFDINGKKKIAKIGDRVFVPRGTIHSIQNSSSVTFNCIVTYTPCSDTHRMFAIFTDLYDQGYRESKLMLKGEWLCREAGLVVFSTSPGFLHIIEKCILFILVPIAKLKGWDREALKYSSEHDPHC